MINLRPYQNKIVSELRAKMGQGKKNLVLTAPTGSGKTITFTSMVSSAISKGKSVLVLTHRMEILTQADGSFSKFGLNPELITAGSKPDLSKSLFIGMVETFYRRINDLDTQHLIERLDLLIVDEAHLSSFDKIYPFLSDKTFVIGATATPIRTGNQQALDHFYNDLVDIVSVQDLIDQGYLVKPKTYGTDLSEINSIKKTAGDFNSKALGDFYDENKIYRGVISNYNRLAKGKKTIVFTSNIESSLNLVAQFQINCINAKHIDGKTPKSERESILKWFNDTPDAVICNCGVLTTGFDQPDIECVILYRATTSRSLFMQMAGRGGRIYPGKSEWLLLDFGENIKRFGKWEDDYKWTISKKPKKEGIAPMKTCPNCGFMTYASAVKCDDCLFEFHVNEKKETPEVKLTEIKDRTPDFLKGRRVSDLDTSELIKLQKSKRFKSSFIWRVVRSHGEGSIKRYASMMGYSNGWIYRQLQEINNVKFKDVLL